MGSVCSGGTKEQNTKLEEKTTTGFSGKLKSIKSFGKQKSNSLPVTNGAGVDKSRQRHDPGGDSGSRFSRELEPPTPSRTSTSRHSISEVKDEMEKTLHWLVPVATNTTKAHQGFGWVGEWANTSIEFRRNAAPNVTLTRLQTLHHADNQKTDECILELEAWLHHLIRLIKQRDHDVKARPLRSPTSQGLVFHSKMRRIQSLNDGTNPQRTKLSVEEVNLLNKATARRTNPGISRSQELPLRKSKDIRVLASRSAGNCPERSFRKRNTLKVSHTNILDVLDGLSQANIKGDIQRISP